MAYSHVYANFYGLRQKAGAALSAVWHFRPVRFYLIGALVWQLLAWWEAILYLPPFYPATYWSCIITWISAWTWWPIRPGFLFTP